MLKEVSGKCGMQRLQRTSTLQSAQNNLAKGRIADRHCTRLNHVSYNIERRAFMVGWQQNLSKLKSVANYRAFCNKK